jgi:hypothetical protein
MQAKWYEPGALAIYGVLATIVVIEGYLLYKTGEATANAYDALLNPVEPKQIRRRKKTARGKAKKTSRSTRK